MSARGAIFLLLLLATPNLAHAGSNEGNRPSWFRTEVSEDEIYVAFEWNADPGIEAGAAEFSLTMFKDDVYLEPSTGTDYSPALGFRSNLPCAYRDVYNHGAGNVLTVLTGLVEYCGFPATPTTSTIATAVWAGIADAQDSAWQFAVGTNCPSKLRANTRYWFRYSTRAKAESQGYAFSWIEQDGITNILSCPLLNGGVRWNEGERPKWINRLCVPTGLFPRPADTAPVLPGAEIEPEGTQCTRSDADEFFEQQDATMFGTLVGDCDSNDPTIGNEHYDASLNACVAACGLESEPCCAGACLATGLECMEAVNVCVRGPCFDMVDGDYCGSSLPEYDGDTSDLVSCWGSEVVGAATCPSNCHVSPPGVNDYCGSAPIQHVAVRRLHGSNGQGCGNPTADWDHCHTTNGATCLAGQSPSLTYTPESPPEREQFWIVPLGIEPGNPDTLVLDGILLDRLDACYNAGSTWHVLEPQDKLKIDGIQNQLSQGINGWACVQTGYARTGSIVTSDAHMVPIYRIKIPDKSSAFMTPFNVSSDPTCDVQNTGVAWFAWDAS